MKRLVFLCLICVLYKAYGQNHIDLVNLYWRNSPYNQIDQNADDNFHFNSFVGNFKLPVVIGEKSTVVLGSEFLQSRFRSENLGLSVISLNLQLGFMYQLTDKFKSLVMFVPKIATTDFASVKSKSFQYGGLMLNTVERNDNFEWKFGAYYNSEFFGPMLVPLFGFKWNISEKHNLKIIAPVELEYAYQPRARFRTGVKFIGTNASYRLGGNNYLDQADNNVWAFTDFYFTKNLVLNLKAGHSVLRKYRIYPENEKMGLKLGPVNVGDKRTFSAPLFNEGWSFELRFLFRLDLSDQK